MRAGVDASEKEKSILAFAARAPDGEIWIAADLAGDPSPAHTALAALAAKGWLVRAEAAASHSRWRITSEGVAAAKPLQPAA